MSEDLEQDREIFGKDQLGKDGKALKTLDVLKEIVTNDRRWNGAFVWRKARNFDAWVSDEGAPVSGRLEWTIDPVCLPRDRARNSGREVTFDDLTAASYWLDRVYGKAYREKDIRRAMELTAKRAFG
jgi:hypothetical protein